MHIMFTTYRIPFRHDANGISSHEDYNISEWLAQLGRLLAEEPAVGMTANGFLTHNRLGMPGVFRNQVDLPVK